MHSNYSKRNHILWDRNPGHILGAVAFASYFSELQESPSP
jgi:hypothetical protein